MTPARSSGQPPECGNRRREILDRSYLMTQSR